LASGKVIGLFDAAAMEISMRNREKLVLLIISKNI
jgi:hypothetical protein